MDFDLSSDQLALRDGAAMLLERHAGRDVLRQRVGSGTVVGTLPGTGSASEESPGVHNGTPDIGAAHGFDRDLWAAMADQGWLALEVPEEHGGLGLSLVEVAVLCEQIGRVLAPAPYLSSILVLGALWEATTSGENDPTGRIEQWREALATGDLVGAVCWLDRRDQITIDGSGSEATLTGRCGPVMWAPSADVVVVVTPDGIYACRGSDAGLSPAQSAMDRTRELGYFDFVATPALRLGGEEASQRLLNRAAAGLSAEMLGGADQVLAMTVDYAKDRVQFGKPIGSFQAIKHKLADALVDVEGMRSTAYYAAWCAAVDDPEASLAASMAKSWCSDASRRVMAAGLQVHGGIGFTWEHDMHLFLKRSQLDQVSFGSAPWHRDRIAALLAQRLADGERVF